MMIRKSLLITSLVLLFTIATGIAVPHDLYAGAKEVTIRVDGLACPFCAYGLEKKLKKLDGAEEVNIFLNEGKATLVFKDGVSVDREEIERIVKEAGFTPKEIEIRAE